MVTSPKGGDSVLRTGVPDRLKDKRTDAVQCANQICIDQMMPPTCRVICVALIRL